MNLDKRIRYYKANLEDLIHIVKEDRGIKNIEHDIFIDDLIELSEKRKLLTKYKDKESLANQDKRLALLENIKNLRDLRSKKNFLKLFKKCFIKT